MASMAAKVVASYLESKELHYQMLDEEETCMRVGMSLDNTRIDIYLFFEEDNHDVHIVGRNFIKVPEDKLEKMYKVVNQQNKTYRWMKFTVNEDKGEVEVEDDAIIQLDTCGDEAFELIARMSNIVDEAYPDLMKALWA
ncbi:MAG: YbjN domain-containing protein [Lachnospiraceae bacterium]|nr:YbjN domain-containing protein [Lachnospiraceae bacterium]